MYTLIGTRPQTFPKLLRLVKPNGDDKKYWLVTLVVTIDCHNKQTRKSLYMLQAANFNTFVHNNLRNYPTHENFTNDVVGRGLIGDAVRSRVG